MGVSGKKVFSVMAKKSADILGGVETIVAEFQTKAQEGLEKSATALGEAGEFAKGNAEALAESGRILAAGLHELATSYAEQVRSAYETATADAKEIAAIKAPSDFLTLQGEIMRRNFDAAMAFAAKNSEAMLKLANDAIAPISGRMSIAVEKVKQAA